MINFTNKVVVVTGGSEGIGKALVDAFLARGAKVATCGRNFDKLYQLQSSYAGKPLLIYTADVSKEQDCKNFINITIKAYGTIDMLVNNAGISMRSEFKDSELDTLRKIMDTNFWGSVYCTKFAMPFIKKNKGVIVGISSIAGYRGLPGRCGYSSSKFAMNGFLEALRTELSGSGVHVMWVSPGFTSTHIRQSALNQNGEAQGESPVDERKLMSAEACAIYIINAIGRKKRSVVLTRLGKATVLLNRLMPGFTDFLVRKYYYRFGKLIK